MYLFLCNEYFVYFEFAFSNVLILGLALECVSLVHESISTRQTCDSEPFF